MQEFLPNTYPAGAANPCPVCPAGFVYLTSNGHSHQHAGQFQLRRRLRNGLTATVQYTLSKATDDAGAFTGVSLSGSAIAQDWLHLDAEWAPSNFDQRHLVTAQFSTRPASASPAAALIDGADREVLPRLDDDRSADRRQRPAAHADLPDVGRRHRRHRHDSREHDRRIGSGLPDGYYLNPAAYAAPAPGQWGNAGRNSITGPRAVLARRRHRPHVSCGAIGSTSIGGSNATNVLNRVTYAGVNTFVGSPQFGLPTRRTRCARCRRACALRF